MAPDPHSTVWRSIVHPTERRRPTEAMVWLAIAGNVIAALLHLTILVFS